MSSAVALCRLKGNSYLAKVSGGRVLKKLQMLPVIQFLDQSFA